RDPKRTSRTVDRRENPRLKIEGAFDKPHYVTCSEYIGEVLIDECPGALFLPIDTQTWQALKKNHAALVRTIATDLLERVYQAVGGDRSETCRGAARFCSKPLKNPPDRVAINARLNLSLARRDPIQKRVPA